MIIKWIALRLCAHVVIMMDLAAQCVSGVAAEKGKRSKTAEDYCKSPARAESFEKT